MRLRLVLVALGLLVLAGSASTRAQPKAPPPAPVQRDQPAFYQADAAEYDREAGIVTLRGHVELWQNNRVLLADRVTYDRTTGVAAAHGNVVLLEPDGQTVFSDDAELSSGMKDGQNRFQGGFLSLGVLFHRDASPVVIDLDHVVGKKFDGDILAVSSHSLINSVIDHLPDQMMKSLR